MRRLRQSGAARRQRAAAFAGSPDSIAEVLDTSRCQFSEQGACWQYGDDYDITDIHRPISQAV
jgi:hypothetical protein